MEGAALRREVERSAQEAKGMAEKAATAVLIAEKEEASREVLRAAREAADEAAAAAARAADLKNLALEEEVVGVRGRLESVSEALRAGHERDLEERERRVREEVGDKVGVLSWGWGLQARGRHVGLPPCARGRWRRPYEGLPCVVITRKGYGETRLLYPVGVRNLNGVVFGG